MSLKYTYEEVKEFIESFGYVLLTEYYINNRQKLVYQDKDGYLYSINFSGFKKGVRPRIADSRSEFSIYNINLWVKNNNKPFILISDKYINKDKKLKWKCLKPECCEIFEMSWHNVLKGQNCSVCRGLQVGLSNCLATKNPDLAKQWHPTLNGDLTPYDVSEFSNKMAFWICDKNPSHIWEANINDRSKYGCPYCANIYPDDVNNLFMQFPEICKDWDYNKNIGKPEDYCPKSNKDIYWKCHKCGHNWSTSISNRTNGKTECPKCTTISHGENIIYNLLNINNIINLPYHRFNDCKNIRTLPFDSYLPYYNTCIEYQGIQHYEPVDFAGKGEVWALEQFKELQKRDQIKRDYCKNSNIKLIEIPYWDFDNIESILIKELNLNINTGINLKVS